MIDDRDIDALHKQLFALKSQIHDLSAKLTIGLCGLGLLILILSFR